MSDPLQSYYTFLQSRFKTTFQLTNSPDLLREHTLLFNSIYLAIVCNDILIAASSFPIAEGFLSTRTPLLFANPTFCTAWGVLWNILPFFSVFLVLTMSILRTTILIRPTVNIKDRALRGVVLGYLLLLLVRSTAFLFLVDVEYVYRSSDQYWSVLLLLRKVIL